MIDRGFVRLVEGQVHFRRTVLQARHKLPVIALHASPSSSRSLVPLMAALAEAGHAVFAPDTLGNGDSAAPAGPEPDIAYFADSVARFADAAGLTEFIVYGSHTGARIACELAASRPDLVRGAVFDGIRDYDGETRDQILAHYAPRVPRDDHGGQLLWAFNFVRDQSLYFPHFLRDAEHRLPGNIPPASQLHDATIDVLKALDTYQLPYLAAFRYRAFERLPAIAAPVLLLKAERELAVLNAAVEEACSLLKKGAIAAVPSTAEAKARAIDAFIAQIAVDRPERIISR